MQVIPMLSEALARLGRHAVQWSTAKPQLVIQVSGTEQRPCCPRCGSDRVRRHGRYWRRPADLPIFGGPVTLEVEVRRLRCMEPDCDGSTFGESLDPFLGRRCRYSERSRATLQRIGCAAAGQAGALLASAMGLRATGDTILRTLRRLPTPEFGEPRVVGIDDWALARGHRYGTVFVDLESRRPLDLVAGREVQEVREWLAQHPGIRIVARDRAGAYAQAARQALPHATQVADRWHLLSNLGEMAERVLLRCAPALRAAATAVNDELRNQSTANAAAAEPVDTAAPTPRTRTRRSAQRRSARLALYEEARRRHDQGQSTRSIARKMKLDIKTVRKFVRADYPAQASELDPWRSHLESRWAEGCRNAMQLWRAIRALGFRGGRSQVRDMFSGRRQQEGRPFHSSSSPPPARHSAPSPRRMRVRLFGGCEGGGTRLRRGPAVVATLSGGGLPYRAGHRQDARHRPAIRRDAAQARRPRIGRVVAAGAG